MTVGGHVQKWWKDAVVYQVYPASFCDSDGDGMGDLPGITSKLDYIASLGANVIWISPMYDSPQVDMGYDISDYEAVYPPYGSLQDMETLIKEAHARDVRIMLDLVINHTSDQHAWFKESRSSKDNPKRDWYIWRPAKHSPSGERMPPNNWRATFGSGSAWEWDEETGEYYLHLFATEQPDVNWENPETRKAIYASAMEFWLERGVDGFRIDTVNMYSKPPGLPDARVIDPDSPYQPAGDIYCNGPRMHEFLGEMNAILARYGAITVGELPHTPDLADVMKYVSAESKELDMVFQFDVVIVGMGGTHWFDKAPKSFALPDFKAAIGRTQSLIQNTDGWTTVFMENHDQARSISRFADDRPEYRVRSAKLLAVLQSCLTGTQFVYQGQEIGSVNAPKESYPLENYLDIGSIGYVEIVKERPGYDEKALDRGFDALQYFARDHARIPVAWNGKGKYGGFSEEADRAGKQVKEPWMKPHPLAGEINVASQLDDPDSPLAFWTKMLRVRREHADLLVYGDYKVLRMDDKDTYTFLKHAPASGAKALVVLNFTTQDKQWTKPDAAELGLADGQEAKLVPVVSTHAGKVQDNVLAPLEGRLYLVSK